MGCLISSQFDKLLGSKISKFQLFIQNLKQHHDVKNFINTKVLDEITQIIQTCQMKPSRLIEIVELIEELVSVASQTYQLKEENIIKMISKKLLKIQNSVHFINKNIMEVLQYSVVPINYSKNTFYSETFASIDFNLDKTQLLVVAQASRYLCNSNLDCVSFITMYLVDSMISKSSKFHSDTIQAEFKQVQEQLDLMIAMLRKKYPPSKAQAITSGDTTKIIDDIKLSMCSSVITYQSIQLQGSPEDKLKLLEEIIIQNGIKAATKLKDFNKLLKYICLEKGFEFKSNTKIKNKNDKAAIHRVIQKILQDDIKNTKMYSLDQYFTLNSDLMIKSSNQSRDRKNVFLDYIEKQLLQCNQKIKNIISTKDKLELTVCDLLRGKCMFSNIEDLVETFQLIVNNLKKHKIPLVNIKNRLQSKTKDVTIILKIENIFSQFQMALPFDAVANEFNHKIYELDRTIFYSKITNLYIMNEKWASQLFASLHTLVNTNGQKFSKIKTVTLAKQINWQLIVKKFKIFHSSRGYLKNLQKDQIEYKQLSNKIDQLDAKLMKQIPLSLNQPRKRPLSQLYLNTVSFYDGCYKRSEAYQTIQDYMNSLGNTYQLTQDLANMYFVRAEICRSLQHNDIALLYYGKCLQFQQSLSQNKTSHYATILQKIGHVYINKKVNQSALQHLNQSLLIKNQIGMQETKEYATTLSLIGSVYKDQAKYTNAIVKYQKSYKIIEKIGGQQNVQCANTFSLMGTCYRLQSNHQQAEKWYRKSLYIKQKVYGIQSLSYATTLTDIANLYRAKEDFDQALKSYELSLDIKQKICGKWSLPYANTLANIGTNYRFQGKKDQALSYYQESLKIKEKTVGKKSLDYANTLANIGTIYRQTKKYPQALQIYQQCLQIKQNLPSGRDRIETANTIVNVGLVHMYMDMLEEARADFTSAIDIHLSIGQESIVLGSIYLHLATLEQKSNNNAKAVQLATRACEIYGKKSKKDNKKRIQAEKKLETFKKYIEEPQKQESQVNLVIE